MTRAIGLLMLAAVMGCGPNQRDAEDAWVHLRLDEMRYASRAGRLSEHDRNLLNLPGTEDSLRAEWRARHGR